MVARSRPRLIRVRMKLVVPLTMPMTRRIRSPASDSRSGRMSGMPPPRRPRRAGRPRPSTPPRTARDPQLASSSLLAVTTGLPALRASRIRVRAGSIPPMTSTTTSTSGSATTEWASVVRTPAGSGASALADWLRTATAASSSRSPVRAAIALGVVARAGRTRAPPTLPHPSSPTRNASDHGPEGSSPSRVAGSQRRGRAGRRGSPGGRRLGLRPSRTNTTGGRGTLL